MTSPHQTGLLALLSCLCCHQAAFVSPMWLGRLGRCACREWMVDEIHGRWLVSFRTLDWEAA